MYDWSTVYDLSMMYAWFMYDWLMIHDLFMIYLVFVYDLCMAPYVFIWMYFLMIFRCVLWLSCIFP